MHGPKGCLVKLVKWRGVRLQCLVVNRTLKTLVGRRTCEDPFRTTTSVWILRRKRTGGYGEFIEGRNKKKLDWLRGHPRGSGAEPQGDQKKRVQREHRRDAHKHRRNPEGGQLEEDCYRIAWENHRTRDRPLTGVRRGGGGENRAEGSALIINGTTRARGIRAKLLYLLIRGGEAGKNIVPPARRLKSSIR